MKKLIFGLPKSIKDIAFPEFRIKERKQLIEICVKCCRELTITLPLDTNQFNIDNTVLVVNKMSRIFFFSEGKYMSIAIPFNIRVNGNNSPIFQHHDSEIDSQMWSLLVSMITKSVEEVRDSQEYIEYCCQADPNEMILSDILVTLQQADYGYLRYDYDPAGFKSAKDQDKPHTHPLYHYDIHLSNQATFKTGILEPLSPEKFINFVDNECDRWYVVPSAIIEAKRLLPR